jgi:heme/copper-type cytochrome/quinol oxidase subunit 1
VNFKPAMYFFGITVIFLILGKLFEKRTLDIQIHDTYFVINYLHIFLALGLLSLIKALIYFGLDKIGMPISSSIGYWHFGLFVIGVIAILGTNYSPQQFTIPEPSSYRIFRIVLAAGLISFLASFVVLVTGIFRAFWFK